MTAPAQHVQLEFNPIYPIGPFEAPEHVSAEMRLSFIQRLEELPATLSAITSHLSPEQLSSRYREGGWTVRQIIHHIADSHINAYTRFRLALTEDNPVIKPYDENAWSSLREIDMTSIDTSVQLLILLHQRWLNTLRSMEEAQFARTYFHPQYKRSTSLDQALALYAWHGDHHVGQVQAAIRLSIQHG